MRPELGQPGTVVGLAPDGVRGVRVDSSSGSKEVPVVHNVWSLSDSDATEVNLIAHDGDAFGSRIEIPGAAQPERQ